MPSRGCFTLLHSTYTSLSGVPDKVHVLGLLGASGPRGHKAHSACAQFDRDGRLELDHWQQAHTFVSTLAVTLGSQAGMTRRVGLVVVDVDYLAIVVDAKRNLQGTAGQLRKRPRIAISGLVGILVWSNLHARLCVPSRSSGVCGRQHACLKSFRREKS